MDFVPGDQYRLDIVGADSTIIVDSWSGQIRANIVGMDGSLIVDYAENKVFGPTIGNVENLAGETVLDVDTKTINGTLLGDVYSPTNELILDSDSGIFYGKLAGNVTDHYGDTIIDITTKSVIADSFSGDFFGNFYGSLSSDSVIYGSLEGDFSGSAYGMFNGEHFGTFNGESEGIHRGLVYGDIIGNVTGEIAVDETNLATAPDDISGRKTWLGSIHHSDGSAILSNTPARADVSVVANIENLSGKRVIDISDTNTVFSGIFQGSLIDENLNDVINTENGKTRIGFASEIDLGSLAHLNNLYINNKHTRHTTPKNEIQNDYIHVAVGVDANGNAVDADPSGKAFGIESMLRHNGIDKKVGLIRFVVDQNKTINPDSAFLPGEIHLTAYSGKTMDYYNDAVVINGDGAISANVFQANPVDFIKRDSLAAKEGMIVFNTNTKKFQGFDGTNWVDLH